MQGDSAFFKVLLLGDPDVGKTALLTRYVDNTFSEQRQWTATFDEKLKKVPVQDRIVALQVSLSRAPFTSFLFCLPALYLSVPMFAFFSFRRNET